MAPALEAILGVEAGRLGAVFLLVLARTAPLAWLAPWLGWRGTAAVARVAVAVVLAAALTPLALSAAPALPIGWLPLALIGIREALVGAAFAVAASLPLYALGWTGALIDRWRGSPADATVPGPHDATGPLGALHLMVAVVLFVSLGGHRLALAAFADGLVALPPGAGADASSLSAFGLGAARLVTAALELALAFAAPAVVAFAALEASIALFGRVAPTVRVWMEGMPLRAGLGVAAALLGLAALLPRLGPTFARSIEAAAELVRGMR